MTEIKEAELEQINPCYAMKAEFLYTDSEMTYTQRKNTDEDIYDCPDNCLPRRTTAKKSFVVEKQKIILVTTILCTSVLILMLSIASVALSLNHMFSSSQERSTLALDFYQNAVNRSYLDVQMEVLNSNILIEVANIAEEIKSTATTLHNQTRDSNQDQWKQFDNDIKEIQRDQAMISGLFQMFISVVQINFAQVPICGPGNWLKVIHLNMSDPLQECPTPWKLNDNSITRSCGRPKTVHPSCSSGFFHTYGFEYGEVCGRVIGYSDGTPDGFRRDNDLMQSETLNDVYVDGVSVTHGLHPRTHIWTFAAGFNTGSSAKRRPQQSACPCYNNMINVTVPSFINNSSYFCETNLGSNLLWDGEVCSSSECCEFNTPPWFNVSLPEPTSDAIEVRICADQHSDDEDIRIHYLELYVQ